MARQNRLPAVVRYVLKTVPAARFGGLMLSWRVSQRQDNTHVRVRFEGGDSLDAEVTVDNGYPHRGYTVVGARWRLRQAEAWVETNPDRSSQSYLRAAARRFRDRHDAAVTDVEASWAVAELGAARARARCLRANSPAQALTHYLEARAGVDDAGREYESAAAQSPLRATPEQISALERYRAALTALDEALENLPEGARPRYGHSPRTSLASVEYELGRQRAERSA